MPVTHLTIEVHWVSGRWRWSLVETRFKTEAASGYAKSEDAARTAASRYATLIWPAVPVAEQT